MERQTYAAVAVKISVREVLASVKTIIPMANRAVNNAMKPRILARVSNLESTTMPTIGRRQAMIVAT
jgi:hypothetical protein